MVVKLICSFEVPGFWESLRLIWISWIDDAIACQISLGIGDSFQNDRELNTLTLPETNVAPENRPPQ